MPQILRIHAFKDFYGGIDFVETEKNRLRFRHCRKKEKSAEKVDRTPDLMIFSHTLSQLSYLGFWKGSELMPFLGTGREKTVNVCRIVDSFTQWVWKHKLITLASFGASLYRHDTIARFP